MGAAACNTPPSSPHTELPRIAHVLLHQRSCFVCAPPAAAYFTLIRAMVRSVGDSAHRANHGARAHRRDGVHGVLARPMLRRRRRTSPRLASVCAACAMDGKPCSCGDTGAVLERTAVLRINCAALTIALNVANSLPAALRMRLIAAVADGWHR